MQSKTVKVKNALIKDFLFAGFFIFCFFLIALKDGKYYLVTLEKIKFFSLYLLPSLFPFFILTSLLTSLSEIKTFALKKRKLSGILVYAFLISLICGYPTGSKTVSDLYSEKLISKKEACIFSGICSTSTPFFTIITVGRLNNNYILGLFIFIAHILSVIITGLIINFSFRKTFIYSEVKKDFPKKEESVYDAIKESVIAITVFFGVIVFYALLKEILSDLNILYLPKTFLTSVFKSEDLSESFLSGIFESTGGIISLSKSSSPLKLPLIGFLVSLGGFSVFTQSTYFLKKAKIKTAYFYLSKILHAAITFFLLLIFNLFFF